MSVNVVVDRKRVWKYRTYNIWDPQTISYKHFKEKYTEDINAYHMTYHQSINEQKLNLSSSAVYEQLYGYIYIPS